MALLNHRLPLIARTNSVAPSPHESRTRREALKRSDTAPAKTRTLQGIPGPPSSLHNLGKRLHALRSVPSRPETIGIDSAKASPSRHQNDWALCTMAGACASTLGVAILLGIALGPAPALLSPLTAGVAAGLATLTSASGMRQYVDLRWRAFDGHLPVRNLRSAGLLSGVGFGLGLAPIPIWAGSAVILPLIVSSLAMVGIAATVELWGPDKGRLPSPMQCALGLGAALSCAVGGWSLALGLPATVAMWAGLNVAGLALTLGAATTLLLSIAVRSAPTPLVDALVSPAEEVFSSRLEKVANNSTLAATIVESPPQLLEAVRELRELVARAQDESRGLRGVFSLCLYGPPGTGKTVSAAGVAEAIGGDLITTSASALADETLAPAPVAFVRLIRCLLEADARGRRLGKMQVLFIDEFDDLFKRLDPSHNNLSSFDALGFVLLAETLSMVARNESYVVLATATNNLTTHIRELLAVISRRAPTFVGPIGIDGLERLLKLQLGDLEKKLTDDFDFDLAPLSQAPQTKLLLELMHARGASGRALRYAINMSADWLIANFALSKEKLSPEQLRDELMTRIYDYACDIRGHAPSAPQKPEKKAGSEPAEEWMVDMEQVMSRLKLQQMGYLEAILNISEQLLPSYVSDPETSLAVNLFGLELSVVLLRATTLYVEEIAAPHAQREIDDTPQVAHRYKKPQKAEVQSLLHSLKTVIKNRLPLSLNQLTAP